MGDWVWELNTDGRFTDVSERVQKVLGRAPAWLLGRRPFDLMPAEEARRMEAVFRSIVADARPFHDLECTCLHGNGGLRIMSTSGVPVFGDGGALLGYRGVNRDITDQRRREAELRALMDAIPDLIFFKDADGRYLECNQAFTRFIGRPRAPRLAAPKRPSSTSPTTIC